MLGPISKVSAIGQKGFAERTITATTLPFIELHGTEGSMRVSDPDTFGGTISIACWQPHWVETDTADKIFGRKRRICCAREGTNEASPA
jgi:hypothetical protein